MRRTALALVLAGIGACLAAPAGAAPLPFRARFDAVFGPLGFLVTVEGVGVARVNEAPGGAGGATGGPLTGLVLPAGVLRTTALDFPGTGAISQIRVTASNGTGSFVLGPQGGGGVMPLPGIVSFCLLATCDTAANVLALPLGPIGAGGTAMATGVVDVTVTGQPWTKGMTTISTPAAVTILTGFAHGPLSNTGTTAQSGGLVQLVTPALVHTSIPGLDPLTGYAVLTVILAPEPTSLLLVGGGLALLALGTPRRRSSYRRR